MGNENFQQTDCCTEMMNFEWDNCNSFGNLIHIESHFQWNGEFKHYFSFKLEYSNERTFADIANCLTQNFE